MNNTDQTQCSGKKETSIFKGTTLIEHSVGLTPPLIEHRGWQETVALERNNPIEHRFRSSTTPDETQKVAGCIIKGQD